MPFVTRLAGLSATLACLACLAAGTAGCRPGSASAGHGTHTSTGADTRALAARYLAIARPANRRLDVEENGYTANLHHRLAAAEAALRAQAQTELWFDKQLLAIKFPPSIEATARALVVANQSRIDVTEQQAQSTSIGALLTFVGVHHAKDAAVEAQVRLIRRELGLPPPQTS